MLTHWSSESSIGSPSNFGVAGLSVLNNIAEGAGSDSYPEFRRFLNSDRRSVFENANVIIVFALRSLVTTENAN